MITERISSVKLKIYLNFYFRIKNAEKYFGGFYFNFTSKSIAMRIWLIRAAIACMASGLIFCGCNRQAGNTQNNNQNKQPMIRITRTVFGNVDGKEVYLYELNYPDKMIIRLTNYGGIVTSLVVPDKNGKMDDVVLGFDSLQSYLNGHPYFGCIAGRYANRIAEGRFSIDGREYQLATNNGPNALHGGIKGFDKVVWDSKEYRNGDEAGVELSYLSLDGEEGYPGNLKVRVIYSMMPDNGLKIDYFAETDQPTPVNITHHGYFNLKGEGNGDILEHVLFIDADRYTVVNDQLIPTGELRGVAGTPFDFRQPKTIGRDFSQVPGGYDHNFVLNNPGSYRKVVHVFEPSSGRTMDVFTTEPGIQFYTGNFLDGTLVGKSGKPYRQHYAFCLETQHFPDSPNQPSFPNVILRPGEVYRHTTLYLFGVE